MPRMRMPQVNPLAKFESAPPKQTEQASTVEIEEKRRARLKKTILINKAQIRYQGQN